MKEPLCFVLVPFGKARTREGRAIDFERIYEALFAPAVRGAGLEPIRPEKHSVDAGLHAPTLEQLALCEYALVDLTTADPMVFHALGARDALRPGRTALAFADGFSPPPFSVPLPTTLSYGIAPDGSPADVDGDRVRITRALADASRAAEPLSLFALLERYPGVAHEKTDVFLERVVMDDALREGITRRSKLAADLAPGALREYEQQLGNLKDVESAGLVALLLAYRDVDAHGDMIRLVQAMPAPLARTTTVREQYAFALNRVGRGEEAEAVLDALLSSRGPSSETYALLGRVYKDRYGAARKAGDLMHADTWLARAAETYLKGFEADSRDDFPGVNALTLLAIQNRGDPRIAELLPVVRYAARQRVAAGSAGYWSRAALLELAVIAGDEAEARAQLVDALAARPEPWYVQSTMNNLRLLIDAGAARSWTQGIVDELGSAIVPPD
jgi:hypothetical protein